MMKKTFFISFVTLLFMSVAVMANAQWTTTQLTNNSLWEYDPQINDSGQAVWRGDDGYGYEIFYFGTRPLLPAWPTRLLLSFAPR